MPKAFGSPKYVDPAAFQASVSEHFGPVAAEGRLVGPIADGYRVAYSSRRFSIAVAYDESDGRVETHVDPGWQPTSTRITVVSVCSKRALDPPRGFVKSRGLATPSSELLERRRRASTN